MSAPSTGFLDPEAALCRGDAPTLEMRPGAVYASGPFERRRRELTTISAHLVGQRRAFQTAGQLFFGDDGPDLRLTASRRSPPCASASPVVRSSS